MSVFQYHLGLQSGPQMVGAWRGSVGHDVMLVKVQWQCDLLVK